MGDFECKNCKKKFSSKRNLTNHLHKKVCANEKDFSCAIDAKLKRQHITNYKLVQPMNQ